jgi:flagellar motor switch protein FliG
MKIDGVLEALKVLEGLSFDEQQRILEGIREKNPALASELESKLLTLEDLIYLTPHQCPEFIRDIDLRELGIALRLASEQVKDHIFKLITSSLQKDIEEGLNGKLMRESEAQVYVDRILSVIRAKISLGRMNLSKDGATKYV